MNTGPTESTLPLHIARAYQLAPKARVQIAEPASRVTRTNRDDASADAAELAAARVRGSVSFDQPAGSFAPGTGVLPMYTNPAHRNAAATGVQLGVELGKLIDAEG